MNGLAVFYEAWQLPDKAILVVKFGDDKESMSGEVRLSNELQYLDKERIKEVQQVLRNLAPYMYEKYIL